MKKQDGDELKPFERLARSARLGDRAGRILIDEMRTRGAVTDTRLREMLDKKELAPEEARAVGRAASLFNILDARPELVEAVAETSAEPENLASLDERAWRGLIERSGARPPAGMSRDDYACALRKKTRLLFPAAAIADTLADKSIDEVNRFVGLGLGKVLADPERPAEARQAEAERRVTVAKRFFRDNPRALSLDLTPDSPAVAELRAQYGFGFSNVFTRSGPRKRPWM